MLINFRFGNFRSFRERAELSFVAHAADRRLKSALLATGIEGVSLLPVVAIYGANAAGKTNVLLVLAYFKDAIEDSQALWKPNSGTRVRAFATEKAESTFFETTLVLEGIRYTYGFSAKADHFEEEWLFSYPLGRERLLFRRRTLSQGNERKVEVTLGPQISGDKKIIMNTKDRTRDNSLFLSAAAQDNQKECSAVYKHIKGMDTKHSGLRNDRWMMDITSDIISEKENGYLAAAILNFLKKQIQLSLASLLKNWNLHLLH